MTLRHVMIFHRHGDRTPLVQEVAPLMRMSASEVEWWSTRIATPEELDKLSATSDVVGQEEHIPMYEVLNEGGMHPLGQLTSKGVAEMRLEGVKFRNLYYEKLFSRNNGKRSKLKSEKLNHSDLLYVMSTNVRRTVHSVQAFLGGFFQIESDVHVEGGKESHDIMPSSCWSIYAKSWSKAKGQTESKRFLIRTHEKNCLAPSHSLRVFFDLESVLEEELKLLDQARQEKVIDLGQKLRQALKLPAEEHIPWTLIRDTLSCQRHHGLDFPEGITQEMYMELVEYDAWLWHRLYSKRSFASPAMKEAVAFLSSHIESIIFRLRCDSKFSFFSHKRRGPKMSVFSVHDNSIVALINSFQIRTGDILPDYGATLVFEIHEIRNKHFYIKVLYDNRECQIFEADSALGCPYDHLLKRAAEFIKDPKESDERVEPYS